MSLLNIFKNKKMDLFSLPCDYDGYDLVFESGSTDPKLYDDITNIITNNKLSVNDIAEYNHMSINSNNSDFDLFYDAWISKLLSDGFVVLLDNRLDMKSFVNNINRILKCKGETIKLDVESTVKRYNNELKKYTINNQSINNDFNYDILAANIVAAELRKYGYELICFFNGYDNNIKTIINISEIDKMKIIESKIK